MAGRKKSWWEYITEPLLGGLGGGLAAPLIDPLIDWMGLGPEPPPQPKAPEQNTAVDLLAQKADRERQRRAAMQQYSTMNQGNTDVARALERIRNKWS